MKIATPTKRKATLNLTSLIDVLFILIIFFSVSSTFLEQPGIDLNLPEAESSVDTPLDEVIIQIDKDGKLFLNDKSIEMNSLSGEVKKMLENKTDKSVTLKADSEVTHGTVISIMDLLRRDGIYKITVSTTKPPL